MQSIREVHAKHKKSTRNGESGSASKHGRMKGPIRVEKSRPCGPKIIMMEVKMPCLNFDCL